MNFLILFMFILPSYSFKINTPKILQINNLNCKKAGLKVTKIVSSILAGADHTGHNVLDANSQMIHKILDSEFLSFDMRKDLTLFCIKCAQFGDHTGHNILLSFHHFVDKFL